MHVREVKSLSDQLYLHWRIWGGGVPDPILSFLHTCSPKSACVGGPHPPLKGARPPPPKGNPGSATDLQYCKTKHFICI